MSTWQDVLKLGQTTIDTAGRIDTSIIDSNIASTSLYANDVKEKVDQQFNDEVFDWQSLDISGPGMSQMGTKQSGNYLQETANFAGNLMGGVLNSMAFGLPYLAAELGNNEGFFRGLAEVMTLGAYDPWDQETSAGAWGRGIGEGLGIIVPFGMASKGLTAVARGMTGRSMTGSKKLWSHMSKEASQGFTARYAQKEGAEWIYGAIQRAGGVGSRISKEATEAAFKKGYDNILQDAWGVVNSRAYKGILKQERLAMARGIDDMGNGILEMGLNLSKKQADELAGAFINDASRASLNSLHRITDRWGMKILGGLDKVLVNQGSRAGKFFGMENGHLYASQVMGAMFTDFLIGTAYHQSHWVFQNIAALGFGKTGVEEKLNPQSLAAHNIGASFTEALTSSFGHGAWMSLIGPTRFIKGGSTYGGVGFQKQVMGGLAAIRRSWKPIRNMSTKEMRIKLQLIDDAADGLLHQTLPGIAGKSIAQIPKKELPGLLAKARSEFGKKWLGFMTKEIGMDLFTIEGSGPRMISGMIAMNTPNLYAQWRDDPTEFMNAFGEDGKHIASNILMGMVFSKSGRSFNTKATGKGLGKLFETGDLKEYMSNGVRDMKRMRLGLEILGMNTKDLAGNQGNVMYESSRKHVRNQPFFRKIHELVKPLYVSKVDHSLEGFDVKTAFRKYLVEDLEYKTNSAEYIIEMERFEKFYKIVDAYDQSAPDVHQMFRKVLPKEAYDLVESINNISDVTNASSLTNLIENSKIEAYNNANQVYKDLLKDYIISSYEALGLDYSIVGDQIIVKEIINLTPDFYDNQQSMPKVQGVSAMHVLKNKIAQGSQDGWISVKGKVEASRNVETLTNFVEAANRSRDAMLVHVYGTENVNAGTFSGQGHSTHILMNEPMRMGSKAIDESVQIRNTLTLFSKSKGAKGELWNSVDMSKQKRISELIAGLELDKNPILDLSLSDQSEHAAAIDFFTRVKHIHNLLNPKGSNQKPEISIEDVIGLKEQVESAVGDIFKDPTKFKSLEDQVFNYFHDKISSKQGLPNSTVIAAQHLINGTRVFEKSGVVNDAAGDFVMKTPEGLVMADAVRLLERIAIESPEKYKEIILEQELDKFYTEFQATIEAAGNLIHFTKNTQDVEQIVKVFGVDKVAELLAGAKKFSTYGDFQELIKKTIPLENFQAKIAEVIEKVKPLQGTDKRDAIFYEGLSVLNKKTRDLTKLIQYAFSTHDYQMLINLNKSKLELNSTLGELGKFLSIEPVTGTDVTLGYKQSLVDQITNIESMMKRDYGQINFENYSKYVKEQLALHKVSIDEKISETMINITPSQFESRYGFGSQVVEKIIDRHIRDYKFNKSNTSSLDNAFDALFNAVEVRKSRHLNSKNRSVAETTIDVLQTILTAASSKEVPKVKWVGDKFNLGKDYMLDQPNVGLLNTMEMFGLSREFYLLDKTFLIRDRNDNLKLTSALTLEEIAEFNSTISSKEIEIDNPQGQIDNMKGLAISTLKANFIGPKKYMHIAFDEAVQVVIPIDAARRAVIESYDIGGSVRKELLKHYNENDPVFTDIINLYSDPNKLDLRAVENAIVLGRLLTDTPHILLENNGKILRDLPTIKDIWKRLKMPEFSKGRIYTPEMLDFMSRFYRRKASDIDYFGEVSKAIDSFLLDPATNTFRKLRFSSLKDEADGSYFSSYDRLDSWLSNQNITPAEKTELLAKHKELAKSTVDSATYVTKDTFILLMSELGVRGEWLVRNNQGEIVGFKSGAIKPKGVHVDVKDTGEMLVWYDKTAIFYDPKVEVLLINKNLDGLAFESGNKINKSRAGKGQPVRDNYINTEKGNDVFGETIFDDISKVLGRKTDDHIIELPIHAFNVTNIAREHSAKAGANSTVYMENSKGLSEWTGVSSRIEEFRNFMVRANQNEFSLTALATELIGKDADGGDLSLSKVPVESILSHNGLIIDKWMGNVVADKLFSFFFESSKIGTADVANSSIGPMAPPIHHRMSDMDLAVRTTTKHAVQDGSGNSKQISIGRQKVIGHHNVDSYILDKTFSLNGIATVTSGGEKYKADEAGFFVRRIKYKIDKEDQWADFIVIPWDAGKNGKTTWKIVGNGYELLPDRMIDLNNISKTNKNVDEALVHIDPNFKHIYKAVIDEANDIYKGLYDISQKTDFTNRDVVELLARDNRTFQVGVVDNRQPRNSINDMVINKIPTHKNKSMDIRNRGNSSEQNFVDIIQIQDADHDYDKSSTYASIPGRFLYDISKKSGYELKQDPNAFAESFFAKLNTQLDNSSSLKKHLSIVQNASMLRGRLIKMHNIVTYFINAFKGNKDLARYVDEGNQTYNIRMKSDAELYLVADNIGNWAKVFIDNYKNPTDLYNIQPLVEDILFGKSITGANQTRVFEGMFEIVDRNNQAIPYIDGNYKHLRKHLYDAFVRPLSKYLRFNRGMTEDQQGASKSLKGLDIANGFQTFKNEITNPYLWKNMRSILGDKKDYLDLRAGSQALSDYVTGGRDPLQPVIGASENPYDVAMRSLSTIYDRSITQNRSPKNPGMIEDIIMKAEAGVLLQRYGIGSEDFNRAKLTDELWKYVRNDMDYIELSKLKYRIDALKKDLNFLKRNKFSDPEEMQDTYNKKVELSALASEIEMRLGGQYEYENGNKVVYKVGNFKKGTYKATNDLVFWDPNKELKGGLKGDIVGVVENGNYNSFDIHSGLIAVVNGRRFSLVSPTEQKNNFAKQVAFGSLPLENSPHTGDLNIMIKSQVHSLIHPLYEQMNKEIKSLSKLNLSSEDYVMRRKAKINQYLNDPKLDTPLRRKALIWMLLRPRVDRQRIAYNVDLEGKHINQPAYVENQFARPLWQLLLDIKTKQAFVKDNNITPIEADQLIREIVQRQTLASLGMGNKFLEVALDYDFGDYNARYNRMTYAELNRKDLRTKVKETGVDGEYALETLNEFIHGERLLSPQDMFILEKQLDMTDGLLFIPNQTTKSITNDGILNAPKRVFGKPRTENVVEWTKSLKELWRKQRENCVK